MTSKTIRLIIAFSMYPVVAMFTHDPVTIAVAGTMAGVFVYLLVWTIQLARINKAIPVDKDRMKEKIEEYGRERDERKYDKYEMDDSSNPANPAYPLYDALHEKD